MLFGKNKELRDEVDDWIYDKNFYHKMLTIKDEKRQLIIDKILNKKEKKDFENFWNIYKQIPGKYDFDSTREDRINIIKNLFFENKDNPDITSTLKHEIIWELTRELLIDFNEVEILEKYAKDPVANNFTVEELDEYVKQKEKIFKAKRIQKEKDAEKRRQEEVEKIKKEEEIKNDSKQKEDDDMEGKDLDEYKKDSEDAEEYDDSDDDEDSEEYDYSDDEEEEYDDSDVDDDSDDEDAEEYDDTDEDEDADITNYHILDYEEQTLELEYDLEKIKDAIHSYLDNENLHDLNGFTQGFLSYPTNYFNSIFVSVLYYSAKSFVTRLDDLETIISDALEEYNSSEVRKYLKRNLKEINDNKPLMAEYKEKCKTIKEQAEENEYELVEIKNEIREQWKNNYEDTSSYEIRKFVDELFNGCLHYQAYDLKDLINSLITKHFPLEKNCPIDEGMKVIISRAGACIYTKRLLLSLFDYYDLDINLNNNIKNAINFSDSILRKANEIIQRDREYQDKIAAINKANREYEEKIAQMKTQIKEQKRQQRKENIKKVWKIFQAITDVGVVHDKLDVSKEIQEISNCLFHHYNVERIRKAQLQIRTKLNNATEEQLKNIVHLPWGYVLEEETGISDFNAQIYKLDAIHAILNI